MVAKVTRDGRIVLWEGASLWAFDVSPERAMRTTRMHAHHAFQITLSAGGTVAIRTAAGLTPGPCILIAPDMPHAIEPEGRIALLFVEPESRAGSSLRHMLGGATISSLPDVPGRADLLAAIWDRPVASDAAIVTVGRQVLDSVVGPVGSDPAVDPRIGRVLDRLDLEADCALSAAEAAGIACLSESRFSHLFVEQIGLPFRTFLLWRRLMRAVQELAAGSRLTDAAHAAGFADSAHFSRTFQRMFGLPAAALQLTTVKAQPFRSSRRAGGKRTSGVDI